jgi:hypothetical protein
MTGVYSMATPVPDGEGTWDRITELHQQTKALLLLLEELGLEHRSFLQPVFEQRDALDHIIRAKAVLRGLKQVPDSEEYVRTNLDKAVGHLYRAFFDVADWIGLTLRERLQTELEPYSTEAIHALLPEYYAEIRPVLTQFVSDIANIRGSKDIGKNELIMDVKRYVDIIRTLVGFYVKAQEARPGLEEFKGCEVMVAETRSALEPFSTDAIQACLPQYYTDIWPALTEFATLVASIRVDKDIGKDELKARTERYNGIRLKLVGFYEAVQRARPGLEDFSRHQKKAGSKELLYGIALAVLGALLAYVLM